MTAARVVTAFVVLATLLFTSVARAQTYPNRNIRMIVPYVAGGPVDVAARIVAQKLSDRLGQAIVVENQAGGGGVIGTRAVASATPDGYTLLFTINAHAYGLFNNAGFHPLDSFTPVATVAQWSHVLVVRPAFPAKTLQELAAYAKTRPDTVTFGFGSNTPPQILGAALKTAAGIDLRDVPYRGGAQAIADMLGDRLDMNFGSAATLLPMIRDGKLRALAYTGSRRSADLPDVPTTAEAGFPSVAFIPDAWAAILGPAGLDTAIVNRLSSSVADILNSEETKAALAKLGYEPRPSTPSEFASFLAAETRRWPSIVKEAGLRAE